MTVSEPSQPRVPHGQRSRLPWSIVAFGLVIAAIWGLYWGFHERLATVLAGPVASLISSRSGIGDKIPDPHRFVTLRIWEGALLATVVAVAVMVVLGLYSYLGRFERLSPWRGLITAGGMFLAINVVVFCAQQTVLFWTCLYTRNATQSGFELRQMLRREGQSPVDIVVVGSSQAIQEVQDDLLNRECGQDARTWVLCIGGARAFDLLVTRPKYADMQPDVVVCYLSELNLYNENSSMYERYQMFLDWAGIKDFVSIGGPSGDCFTGLLSGVLSSSMPLFRCRSALHDRLLSPTTLRNLKPLDQRYDERLAKYAKAYRVGPTSEFEKRAFKEFVRRTAASGSTLVICVGQLNPDVTAKLDPAVREDLAKFVAELEGEFKDVVFLRNDRLPYHLPSDYTDFVHVDAKAQEKFTLALAAAIKPVLSEQKARENNAPVAPLK